MTIKMLASELWKGQQRKPQLDSVMFVNVLRLQLPCKTSGDLNVHGGLLAKIGVGTAENEPEIEVQGLFKVVAQLQIFVVAS